MDKIDRMIMDILEKNGRASFVEIGKRVGLSEGAVRRRIKDLVEKKVIKKFTIISRLEKKLKAMVLVNTTPQVPLSNISKKAKGIIGIKEVYEVSGEYDMICFLETDSIDEINKAVDEVRAIKGVIKTVTTFVLK